MTATRLIAASFVATVLASIALIAVYLLGGQPQVEGVLLSIALGALGLGIVVWSIRLLDSPIMVEERHPLATPAEEPEPPAARRDGEPITRRTLLVRLLAAAAGTLVAALSIPVLSLGPQPGDALFQTPWRRGARVVGADGEPIRPAQLGFESVRTVFPEGFVGNADAQTLLIRVQPSLLELPGDRSMWAPEGVVGYSKICTHAGCPVGLYRAEDHALLCPCHQSTFDVLRAAVPVFGPAARPLPQLPLGIDDEGYLVAQGDFPEPVGPSFWNLTWGTRDGPALIEDANPVEGGEDE